MKTVNNNYDSYENLNEELVRNIRQASNEILQEEKFRPLREMNEKMDLIQEMYEKYTLSDLPKGEINRLWNDIMGMKKMTTEEFELVVKLYILGEIDGKRQNKV